MRLKIKGHKKETLQDSFRNFDKYHGLNYQKNNKGNGKYYKWQKVLDREKLVEAMKSQPAFKISLEESRSKQKENQLPASIVMMKAPFFNSPKIKRLANIINEELAESQMVTVNELPLGLRNLMEIPLSEEIAMTTSVNIVSSKIVEEEPVAVAVSSAEPEPVVELERVVSINLNETLDKISLERRSLSEKQMIEEETQSVQKLSKSQPRINPFISQPHVNPFIESAKRLDEMSQSIQNRVRNLNEKLSVTKNSISKMQEARTNSAKSTPISLPGEVLKRLDLNSVGKQSWSFKREEAPKENLGDSQNYFPKPSCQKSGICSASKTGSAKKTPLPLKEFLELQPSAEKSCPCSGKTSENFKVEQHHRERSSEKKIVNQNTWLNSESGVHVRLNKAEILRMEYIRNKNHTPTKTRLIENYCALSSDKRGSDAKTKLEEL